MVNHPDIKLSFKLQLHRHRDLFSTVHDVFFNNLYLKSFFLFGKEVKLVWDEVEEVMLTIEKLWV